jgi:adenosine deaminase
VARVEELELQQHGIAAADSLAVRRAIEDYGIRRKLTAKYALRVDRLETHPLRKLYHLRVTMNTDNASIFGRGFSEEFLGLIRCICCRRAR